MEVGLIKRTITFLRMDYSRVKGYRILSADPSGVIQSETKLLEEIDNPVVPDTNIKKIKLDYNDKITWKLPEDIYMDQDHRFSIFINGFILPPINYSHNRITNLITINEKIQPVEPTDEIFLEYYRNVISRSYLLEDDIKIIVKPIYRDSVQYGGHNMIV